MCTVKMLNHNICNSVIYIYYTFCLSVVYTTCTTSTITLLNYMLIYLISPSNFVHILQVNTTSLLVLSWYSNYIQLCVNN